MIIAGIISKGGSKRVLIRVLGPSLSAFGGPLALTNPRLQVFSGATQLASYDDWRSDQEAEIIATGLAPGFDSESAVILNLPEGPFTTIVSGPTATVGHAIVEVFELD